MADQEQQGNIRQEYNNATVGLNQDQSVNQLRKGQLTYALNAAVENYNDSSINYQNEVGNELCLVFPEGYVLIGKHFIAERNKHIFFITNPNTGDSEIGYMINNDCCYNTLVSSVCLNFNIYHPIHKVVHKITNCTTEIYWTDGFNPRRYLDIDHIPYLLDYGSPLCDGQYSTTLDCNQLKLQPNFSIPSLDINNVVAGGNLIAGTYQFAIQYSDANSNAYTSYYSVTNPTPIADPYITTLNFNYPVGKSIIIDVTNLDSTGHFQYFNIAVIKTINAASSVNLIGTYYIDNTSKQITYTGEDLISLSLNDIFEKYPFYDIAQDLTAVQDILIWDNLTSIDRINYQGIANNIKLQWETWRIPSTENYANELNATNLRGYLRDEVYAFEIVFLLKNGKQTDGFHIPGREKDFIENNSPDILSTDPDFVGSPTNPDGVGSSPYWKIYNTASVSGYSNGYSSDSNYKGAYQYGEFAYWESTEQYPCNESLWGELSGKNIRHHKFPDVLVSPIFESKLFLSPESMVMGNDAIFPIGVHLESQQVNSLIATSGLTTDQKADIIGFKIVRGDRSTNKSIVAKGILRNVGTYTRENQNFYYPNYPYNDLNADPFLTSTNNAYQDICKSYTVSFLQLVNDPSGNNYADVYYTDCSTNKQTSIRVTSLDSIEICSNVLPIINSPARGRVSLSNYEHWHIRNSNIATYVRVAWIDPVEGYTVYSLSANESRQILVVSGTSKPVQIGGAGTLHATYISSNTSSSQCDVVSPLPSIKSNNELKYRQIFNSPETSFGQPYLGNILKLENIIFGTGNAHFTEVKNNAKYKLISEYAQKAALDSANKLGALTSPFNPAAMFSAYQSYLTIYINGITRKNFAYSFNSIADYNYNTSIPNELGIKQRNVNIARYLIPGVQSVNDDLVVNNYQRESSVYLKTEETRNNITINSLPFPDDSAGGIVTEKSRFTISEIGHCSTPAKDTPIQVISYYASLKNDVVNQWGQIYSYLTVDTGFQENVNSSVSQASTIFGGDTFIGRWTFKTKLPFFFDNRVDAPDDSDIFYDEIGNVGYPKYWHSARSVLKDYVSGGGLLSNIISYKAHNFDCPNDNPQDFYSYGGTTTSSTTAAPIDNSVITGSTLTYYDGYYYLFAYGVPNFYCESSYNLDLRQAFNDREGDFWPHVNSHIPDDWVQEHFVSINQDNTYTYNTTFSKQNKENSFSHLPPDWATQSCYTYFPFRVIYSNQQNTEATNTVNNWLTYAPISYFDLPQTFGKLTSLDGIQNRAILARFENKSLMYNNLLTVDTSNPQAAYFGNPLLFKGAPPIDFAETDLGYVGSQHKILLKIPQGQITIDAKRGQVFLISGTQAVDLSAFGSGMNRFFTDHLAFEIIRYFPDVDVDNNFIGIGLHAVYDSKYDRIIITKLDYIPLDSNIIYDNTTYSFYMPYVVNTEILKTKISLTDSDYFCNKSWTLSYNMNTRSWVSFHSYIPNWYIAENNFFYSGLNGCCDSCNGFDFIVGTLDKNACTLTASVNCSYTPIGACVLDANILCNFTTTSTTSTSSSTSSTTTSTTTINNCLLEASIICDTSITTTSTTTPICDINVNTLQSCTTLGSASNFTILGYSTITNTGSTIITGDLGLYPGTSVTGFPPGIVNGIQYIANTIANNARIDATTAYTSLAALPSTGSVGADIGGMSITPGIYNVSSSLAITGTLTLDGGGNSNAVFIFKIPSTFIPSNYSSIQLINGTQPCNIYWLVGSSATLSIGSTIVGNIIATVSITLNTNAILTGRAFALNGAVTMDTNTVTNCQCTTNPIII